MQSECGCRRSLSGIDTSKATTTFKVVDMDITREEFAEKLTVFYNERRCMEKAKAAQEAKEEVDELVRMANAFLEGDILEKRGNRLSLRAEAQTGCKTC